MTRYLTPAFDTEVIGDIVFGQSPTVAGHQEDLRLDVYLPVDDPEPLRPTILWFHGGGFRPGNDKRQRYIQFFAEAFAARGYVGIAPDYRLRADPHQDLAGTIHDAVEDAWMALDWVRAHSQEYRIDTQRLVIAGGSAGGMLVLNLCHAPARPLTKDDGVLAMINLWGSPGGPQRLFERVNAASPPTLFIHGTADALVPYANSEKLAEELIQAEVITSLLTLPDAPHTPVQHKDHMIAVIVQFLVEHLGDS